MTRTVIILLIVAATGLSLPGCKGDGAKDKKPQEQAGRIELTVVYPDELSELMGIYRKEFLSKGPSLTDGRVVVIRPIRESGVQAAKSIAKGTLKTVLWVAPSSSLVQWTNSTLANLGPRQEDCTQLFGTPMVLGVQPQDQEYLGAKKQRVSWRDLILNHLRGVENGSAPKKKRYVTLSHATPGVSVTGLPSVLQLAYFAAASPEQGLAIDTIMSEEVRQQLKDYEGLISHYGSHETHLLKRTARKDNKRVRILLTTEQLLASFNKKRSPGKPQLMALYAEEGSYWQDYNVCRSDADWVTPAHVVASRLFIDFLKSKKAQLDAKKFGFRPSVVQFADIAPFTSGFGVNAKLPERSLLPVSGPVIGDLLENWDEFRKPAANVLVVDVSGSMEGEPLRVGKKQLQYMLALSSKRDQSALISLGTEPVVVSPFTSDRRKVAVALEELESLGGSAVYDSIKKAVELITESDFGSYRKNILIFTDGEDRNSFLPLHQITTIVADRFSSHDINLAIIALEKPGVTHSDLQEIGQVTGGEYFQGPLEKIDGVFLRVFRHL